MNHTQFWQIIDKAREKGDGWEEMFEPLVKLLQKLDMADIMLWHQIFTEYQRLSYKEKLWAAAYIINGGCSDDGFDYFRGWLTAQGKEVFMKALADPDSLADEEACEEDVAFEDILGAAPDAYFEKLKMKERDYDKFDAELDKYPLPDEIKTAMAAEIRYADDIDVKWNEGGLPRLLPKLCEVFGWDENSSEEEDEEAPDLLSMNTEDQLALLNQWHEDDKHRLIVKSIEAAYAERLNLTIAGLYARALNNLDREDEALNILLSFKDEGKDDALWNYRVGYALYYLNREEEALEHVRRAIELGDHHENTYELLNEIEQFLAGNDPHATGQSNIDPPKYVETSPGGSEIYQYSSNENTGLRPPQNYGVFAEAVNKHFDELFPGRETFVFHELVSDLVHIDVNIMKPIENDNFYVIFTTGMSDLPMTLPESLKDRDDLKYAELFMFLPESWNPGETGTISNDMPYEQFWPIQLIKYLARFPHEYKTWLGFGHSIPNGPDYEPFLEGSELGGVLLMELDEKYSQLITPEEQTLNMLAVMPASRAEIEYKLEHGMNALCDIFDEEDLPMEIDIYRKSLI